MTFECIKEQNAKVIFSTPHEGSYFFGYYDVCPLNADGTKLLAHHTKFDARDVQPGDVCEVGYFILDDMKFYKIDDTTTFNWQQGARLQWVPGSDTDIYYNKCENDRFICVRYNIETNKIVKLYDEPMYAISPDNLNFSVRAP